MAGLVCGRRRPNYDLMKKLLCHDTGFAECEWEFLGESEDEVLRKAREHDQRMHGVNVDESRLRPQIRDV
jgi:predicted small metal-binding protein